VGFSTNHAINPALSVKALVLLASWWFNSFFRFPSDFSFQLSQFLLLPYAAL
jgi:hypothetical protein